MGKALVILAFVFLVEGSHAIERQSDPDGCFSCHGLPNLEYIDANGVRRVATILKKDYYASLHGSVPCTDCHRKIRYYPHDPKDGYVDCSESCHIQEPSEAKSFSHKDIVKEFQNSAHGDSEKGGKTSGFHGGNRLSELENDQNPSCRRCHYNEPYILPSKMAAFQKYFNHIDSECGVCHRGVAWKNQYKGHILRRFIGNHYSKQDANSMCISCHGDHERMQKVKVQDFESKEWRSVGPRFIFSVDTYVKTLHGRLIEVGNEKGSSCIDCHAPRSEISFRHNILRYRDPRSSTHKDKLSETCGQLDCHGDYARDQRNKLFISTDVHSLEWVSITNWFDNENVVKLLLTRFNEIFGDSGWYVTFLALFPLAAIFSLLQPLFLILGKYKGFALFGGKSFQRRMLGAYVQPGFVTKLLDLVRHSKEAEKIQVDEINDCFCILYGSQTGNSKGVAEQLFDLVNKWHLPCEIFDMLEFQPKFLSKYRYLFIIVSTYGEGEPPVSAQLLHSYLKELVSRGSSNVLRHISYSVFGLGDSSYKYFCQCAKDFDSFLEQLGATRLLPRVDADVDYEKLSFDWMEQAVRKYRDISGKLGVEPEIISLQPQSPSCIYSKANPYLADVIKNLNLNGPGSAKETRHIEISIDGSGLSYEPGDVLGVYPKNSASYVEEVLGLMGWSGYEEIVVDQKVLTIRDALFSYFDITTLSRSLLEKYFVALDSRPEVVKSIESMEEYMQGRQLIDLLMDYPIPYSPKEFIRLLRRLPPRLYSISSSLKLHPNQVHLTVGVVRYFSHGRWREGVCSNYLKRSAFGSKIQIFIQTNPHFRLPADPSTSIIMVGPGTGVAPFRAFLEEREAIGARGRSWLFFGDQHKSCDFLYEEEFVDKLKKGILTRLDLAFSRDQPQRIYVQHRMMEHAKDIYDWLENGAYFYVCGDAARMARDVHSTLIKIIMQVGGLSEEKAIEYLKQLELSGRYAKDVY